MNDFIHTLVTVHDNCKKIREQKILLNLSICRDWDVYRGRRG